MDAGNGYRDLRHEKDREQGRDISSPYINMEEIQCWLERIKTRISEGELGLANLENALAVAEDEETRTVLRGSIADFTADLAVLESQRRIAEKRIVDFHDYHIASSILLDRLDPQTATEH